MFNLTLATHTYKTQKRKFFEIYKYILGYSQLFYHFFDKYNTLNGKTRTRNRSIIIEVN